MDHGLSDQATEAFISLYHQTNDDGEKAKCLLNMGKISLKNGNTVVALKDWNRLVKNFPNSAEAVEVKDQLNGLLESSQSDISSNINSAIALNYINNANFFSEDKGKFTIDTSYLPSEDFAAYWLDRVIKEFPETNAHEYALRKKFIIFMGWEDRYTAYGLKGYPDIYLAKLKDIITQMETKFPESSSLPGMYFQIGQYYWPRKDPKLAKEWFLKSQKASGEGNYYSQLVEQRLDNWDKRGQELRVAIDKAVDHLEKGQATSIQLYVSVLGEVNTRRGVSYTPGLTLLEAIAQCGGFSDFANPKRVKLTREGKATIHDLSRTTSDANVKLQPNDIITVPARGLFRGG